MGSSAGRTDCLLRGRKETFALKLLARKLALAANCLGLFPDTLLGWLFIGAARLELAEQTFALHLLLQDTERLVDIVVSNENLQILSFRAANSFAGWSEWKLLPHPNA